MKLFFENKIYITSSGMFKNMNVSESLPTDNSGLK